jgi:RND family efflux transporter MFP subunit
MTAHEKKMMLAGLALGVVVSSGIYLARPALSHRLQGASAASAAAPNPTPAGAAAPPEGTASARPASAEIRSVELSDEEQKAIRLQTVDVKPRRFARTLLVPGRVEEPETGLVLVSARVGGRVEKLYVAYTGQAVRRGEPIAAIYSPDVLQSAREYKLALENRAGLHSALPVAVEQADEMVTASRRRLELWGLTAEQIAEIGSNNEPKVELAIYSPASGIVTERKVTRGQYVKEGDVLYTLADLSSVWIKADVFETDLPSVRIGQAVEITSDALGVVLRGRVQFVEPALNAQTRTVAVRIQVLNPGLKLRPGMFANVALRSQESAMVTAVPRSAVLDTGLRKLVYVDRGRGRFESRAVEVGPPDQDFYPVISGLKTGERVVAQGAFMVDSQTRLTAGMTGLYGGSTEFERGRGNTLSGTPASQVKIIFRTTPSPPRGAAQNVVHVEVTDAAGHPVRDAQVKATFLMPAMPGMGEMRSSADLTWNGKEYAGKADIPMAGPYNVVVEASRGGQAIGSYRTRLNAE